MPPTTAADRRRIAALRRAIAPYGYRLESTGKPVRSLRIVDLRDECTPCGGAMNLDAAEAWFVKEQAKAEQHRRARASRAA